MNQKSPHPIVNMIVFWSLLFGTGFGVGNALFSSLHKKRIHEEEIRKRIRNKIT